MKFSLWTVLNLVACTAGRDFYFYADVRWDHVEYYARIVLENDIPYNHGLRIMPAIWVAAMKINEGLRIWSRSPTINDGIVNNRFYQSNAEYAAICKAIDGSESTSDCFVNSNYDIGFCSPRPLEPVKDPTTGSALHCKNNPPDGHILSFKEKNNTYSSSIPFLKSGEKLHIILPDGTGLKVNHRREFRARFVGGPGRARSSSLGDLHERIKYIADLYGDDFAGIIGSTDNAYYTAIIAKNLKVPNIVPTVSDKEGR
jgi:hypothetical protein